MAFNKKQKNMKTIKKRLQKMKEFLLALGFLLIALISTLCFVLIIGIATVIALIIGAPIILYERLSKQKACS